jgi:hypothetical protein
MNRHYIIFPYLLFFFLGTSLIQAQDIKIAQIAVVEAGENGIAVDQHSSTGTIKPLSLESDPSLAVDGDLFGTPGGGYVHPFLNISGEYTDNLFNVKNNEKSNFLTRITPGIWLALPRSKEVPITINPNNTSPGGLHVALKDTKGFDRINAYILGALEFKDYSEDSDLNDYDARVEGLFQINLRGGLSFRAIDRFSRSQDRFGLDNATSGNLRQYYSNIVLTDLDWDFSEKLRTKIEYSNFSLEYSDDINNEFDRTDNSFSWYGYYDYSPKTSLLLQYQYITTRYDTAVIKDNNNSFIYGGIDWSASDKTFLHLKAGYQQKKFTNDTLNDSIETAEDTDGLAIELAMDYQFTQKTGMTFTLSHKLDESDTVSTLNKRVSKSVFQYHQKFTDRLLGRLMLSYETDDYLQDLEVDRDDNRYIVQPAIQYVFRDWLMAELAYSYDTRNSTMNTFDYKTHTLFFSLNSAL